jgi:endonuclease
MMPIYEKSTSQLLSEYLTANYKLGDTVDRDKIINWFSDNYPRIKRNTVTCHIIKFTINNRTRVHYNATPQTDYLFQRGDKSLRIYDPDRDPKPKYTIEEFDDVGPIEPLDDTCGAQFAYESHLRDFLKDNLDILEPGLRLYKDEEDESIVGVEFDCGGRRIDILAIDASGTYVVIELKVSKGYERTIGQLLRYKSWVRKEMASGNPVRGVIIAKSISPDLKLAAEEINGIQLYEYDLSIQLRKA